MYSYTIFIQFLYNSYFQNYIKSKSYSFWKFLKTWKYIDYEYQKTEFYLIKK
jgi:hypothetical protein